MGLANCWKCSWLFDRGSTWLHFIKICRHYFIVACLAERASLTRPAVLSHESIRPPICPSWWSSSINPHRQLLPIPCRFANGIVVSVVSSCLFGTCAMPSPSSYYFVSFSIDVASLFYFCSLVVVGAINNSTNSIIVVVVLEMQVSVTTPVNNQPHSLACQGRFEIEIRYWHKIIF